MSSQSIDLTEWKQITARILEFEQEGLVTRTFRRLDPQRQQAVLAAILDEAIEKGTGGHQHQAGGRAGRSGDRIVVPVLRQP